MRALRGPGDVARSDGDQGALVWTRQVLLNAFISAASHIPGEDAALHVASMHCRYGGRDGGALIYCHYGCDWGSLFAAIAGETRQEWTPRRDRSEGDPLLKQKRASALWQGSRQIAGTPAELYLARRGLPEIITSPALRFCPAAPHPEARGRLPALIGWWRTYQDMPLRFTELLSRQMA